MLHRAPATTTYESGIDWRFVQSLDPVMIQQTRDFNSMQEFVNSFMGSEINQGDRNVLCHPLSHKLALLSQVTIKYMFDCQDQLKKRIAELEARVGTQHQKIKLLLRAQDQARELMRDAYHDFEKCPVCGKKFKAMRYVDRHMESAHPDHMYAWKSLRIDQPINPSEKVQELEDEVASLRELMNQQSRKYAESLANFNMKLAAYKREAKQRERDSRVVVEHYEPDSSHLFCRRKGARDDENEVPQNEKFKQKVLHVDKDDDKGEVDEDINVTIERMSRKVASEAERIHVGLGCNYVTPRQVAGILRYDNRAYRNLLDAAREQLERDFPMPDQKKGKQPERRQPKPSLGKKLLSSSRSSYITSSSSSKPQQKQPATMSGLESSSLRLTTSPGGPSDTDSGIVRKYPKQPASSHGSQSVPKPASDQSEKGLVPEFSDYADSSSDSGEVKKPDLQPLSSDEFTLD